MPLLAERFDCDLVSSDHLAGFEFLSDVSRLLARSAGYRRPIPVARHGYARLVVFVVRLQ